MEALFVCIGMLVWFILGLIIGLYSKPQYEVSNGKILAYCYTLGEAGSLKKKLDYAELCASDPSGYLAVGGFINRIHELEEKLKKMESQCDTVDLTPTPFREINSRYFGVKDV